MSIAAGDLNGDHRLDLVTANEDANDVAVLLGDGDGDFAAPASVPLSGAPFSVAAGDLNGDGKPDLAVARSGSDGISVLPGTGTGGFGAATSVTTGLAPQEVAMGDVNRDAKLDLAVANTDASTVSVLVNIDGPPCLAPSTAMILILGGTAEARELAAGLDARGVSVTSSLAGRVKRPRLPEGKTRIGGFGGPEALARWIAGHGVRAVVDATHPFAERISASAAQACPQAGVALLRLERPGWSERPGDRWRWVGDLGEAAAMVAPSREGATREEAARSAADAPPGSAGPGVAAPPRVLLTTGRQGLAAFAAIEDAWFLVRCVDEPDPPLPPHHELLLDRGPYTPQGELALIDAHAIDLVVTKDSGGEHTVAKLDAARERGLPVIVVRRPGRPDDVQTVTTVGEALEWASAAAGTCP